MSSQQILIINGSASKNSSNERLIGKIIELLGDAYPAFVFDKLKQLPHFDPDLSANDPPQSIIDFRNLIEKADGVIICTPEYIFSVPSGLKNAIEWCVATTLFTDKPVGLVTASAGGEKGHAELQLIMQTLMAQLNEDTNLLIQGIKGKIDLNGQLIHPQTKSSLRNFVSSFTSVLKS